jgi:hypothetical protein
MWHPAMTGLSIASDRATIVPDYLGIHRAPKGTILGFFSTISRHVCYTVSSLEH